ncbi:MAG TPA: ATP-binding protein [Chloroflexota bacterium]
MRRFRVLKPWRQAGLIFAAALLGTLAVDFAARLLPGVSGAILASAVAAYRVRQRKPEPRLCGALGIACLLWVVGQVLASRVPLGLPLGLVDLGALGFAGIAAVAQLAWPEVRRGTVPLLETLVDALMVVAAVALWGVVGFPPLRALAPNLSLGEMARATAFLLPMAVSLGALPRLAGGRRRPGTILAAAMIGLWVEEIFESQGAFGAHGVPLLERVLAAGAFAAITAAFPLIDRLRAEDLSQPMAGVRWVRLGFGLAGPAAFAVALLVHEAAPGLGTAAIVLALCEAAHEALRLWEIRRGETRIREAMRLGDCLTDLLVADIRPGAPQLRPVCRAISTLVDADAVLIWTRDDDQLFVTGANSPELEALAVPPVFVGDSHDLASTAFTTGRLQLSEGFEAVKHLPQPLARIFGEGAFLAAPLGEPPLGALLLARRAGAPVFDALEQACAAQVGQQLGALLGRSSRLLELEARLQGAALASLVYRFSMETVAAQHAHEVAQCLLDSVEARVNFDRGEVRVVDSASAQRWRTIATVRRKRAADSGDPPKRLRTQLVHGRRQVGELVLERATEPFRHADEQTTEALAQVAAMVLYNSLLREEARKVSEDRDIHRAKSDLLSTISHEMRNSITVIEGYADRLAASVDELADEEHAISVESIGEESERLKGYLEDLLTLSAIDAGKFTVDPQPVRLRRLAEQAISGVRKQGYQFECDVSEDILLMGDRNRLRQVFDNLLSNAVKYSPEGGLIRISATGEQKQVVVSVGDEGIGVPRAEWERIFRYYERSEGAKRKGIMGTGLGLAICKGIVEAHSGRIWVESEPGKGSVFSFTMPAVPASVLAEL